MRKADRKAQACRHACATLCMLIAACPVISAAQEIDLALGASVYAHNCAACHQANGEGIAGAFPALKASPLVLGDAQTLLQVVLAGRGGMPTFNTALSDAEVAAVASYIRSAWGNQAEAIRAAQAHEASRRIDAVADEGGRGN